MTGEAVEMAEFAGDWTLDMVLATRARVPVLGDFLARSRSSLAVRIDVVGGHAVQTQRVCSTTVNDGRGLVRTEIPQAVIAALPAASFPIDLSLRDGAWVYAADFGRQVIGWTGEGVIPTQPTDPRVQDGDGDGRPGFTVRVEGPILGAGEVYVVQAGRTTVAGTWDGTAFSGSVGMPEFAQSVVGASSTFLLHGPELRTAPEQSSFRMVRGQAACGPIPQGTGVR